MRRPTFRFAAAPRPARRLALALAGALAVAVPAAAQDPATDAQEGSEVAITRTDGDWQTVCRSATEGPCFIRQVGKTADGQEVLEMSIRKVPPQQTQAGTVESVLNVRVPLGVLLTVGLGLQIDQAQPQTGAFAICAAEGCLLREPLPNEMVNAFRRGVTTKLSFSIPGADAPQRIDATVSLRGFTAAYAALQP